MLALAHPADWRVADMPQLVLHAIVPNCWSYLRKWRPRLLQSRGFALRGRSTTAISIKPIEIVGRANHG
jgi:hypothetical protein